MCRHCCEGVGTAVTRGTPASRGANSSATESTKAGAVFSTATSPGRKAAAPHAQRFSNPAAANQGRFCTRICSSPMHTVLAQQLYEDFISYWQ